MYLSPFPNMHRATNEMRNHLNLYVVEKYAFLRERRSIHLPETFLIRGNGPGKLTRHHASERIMAEGRIR
jgi:hypothetical protein